MLAAIALGSNLPSVYGDSAATVREAMRRLAELGDVRAVSGLYVTEPVGYLDQPQFVNAAAVVETELSPLEVLRALLAMEHSFGRDRTGAVAKGPRTLDLDLLLYGAEVLADPELTLPHPAMHERRFVLEPLAEIAAEWVHPVMGKTVGELLANNLAPKKHRSSLWILTTANLLCAGLELLFLYGILQALGAFAAGIVAWVQYAVLLLPVAGIVFAWFALRASGRSIGKGKRGALLVINALPLLLYALLLAGAATMFAKTTRRRFILPYHYQGEVYLLHSPKGQPGYKTWWRTDYEVPANGIAVTSDGSIDGFVSDSYVYRRPNGSFETLKDFEPGTMPSTPENLANTTTYGVYFPRSGSGGAEITLGPGQLTKTCVWKDDEVWVGTPAALLAHYKETDVAGYMKLHPDLCLPN